MEAEAKAVEQWNQMDIDLKGKGKKKKMEHEAFF